jgi:hypothetical protein
MERYCRAGKPGMKHRRQNMLASVLLHVIEAPLPVNDSLHRANFDGPIDNVDDFIFYIEDIQHTRIPQPSQIVRLAAGSGIKCSAI